MSSLLLAFFISAVSLFVLIAMAPRLGLIDRPTGRKQHKKPTPAVGGVAIILSSIVLLASPEVIASDYKWLLPAMCLLAVLGVLDDIREISYKIRVPIQLLGGGVMVFLGGTVLASFGDLLGFGRIALGVIAVPLTLFAVASAVNAMNLSDGVDGLAGGLALIPLVILSVMATQAGYSVQAAVAATFAAGLAAFMLFNYPFPWLKQAYCFLGDTGSSILGFVIVWLMIDLSQLGVIDPITALYLMGLPLLDTAGVIIRRHRAGLSLMRPGRDHLHHMLLDAGFTVAQTVVILQVAGLLFALLGVAFAVTPAPESLAFGVYLGALAVFVVGTRSPAAATLYFSSFVGGFEARKHRSNRRGQPLVVIPGGRDAQPGYDEALENSPEPKIANGMTVPPQGMLSRRSRT